MAIDETSSKMAVDETNSKAVEVTSDEDEIYTSNKLINRFTRYYRSPLFNFILVSLISFTQPGIWNALHNTGAGGQQEPYLVNGANSLTFEYALTRSISV